MNDTSSPPPGPPPGRPDKPPTWRERLRPMVEKVAPAVRVAERVTQFAVQLQKPTSVLGAVGLASAAISGVREALGGQTPTGGMCSIETMAQRAWIIAAFERAGATLVHERLESGRDMSMVSLHGQSMRIFADDSIGIPFISAEMVEWLRQLLDPVLPNVLAVHRADGEGGTPHYEVEPVKLAAIDSRQAAEIWASTQPLLGGGRCILIEGRPGVGKTTMAQAIARRAELGRVLLLDANVVGGDTETGRGPRGDLPHTLRLMSAGVIVVDDIDKAYLPLKTIEDLRRSAKLVIFTANNGQHDAVLDGAMMRAGRVDEVFPVAPEHSDRRAPFDRLADAEWEEVREWPIAYLNEVEKRLVHRPHDLRLPDLRARLSRRVRSGDELL